MSDNHSFTKGEKITILCIVVAAAILFGWAGWFFGKAGAGVEVSKVSEENTRLVREKDSLSWVVGARDRSISKKDSLVSVLMARQAISDSFYVKNFIKNKNEIKYIQNVDSIGRRNRIDSIMRGTKARR